MIKRINHNRAYLSGTVIASLLLYLIILPGNANYHAPGPMNTGHEKLNCNDCHTTANGTLRQQLQANSQYLTGLANNPVAFGFNKVASSICANCHQRPEDDHPIYRFKEPKYADIKQKIQADQCNSCHREHSNRRVTVTLQFCQHCHDQLKINNDTISIPHADLVKTDNWDSCMGCHDYHGNHKMKLKTNVSEIIQVTKINRYFQAAKSPYSQHKKYRAKDTRVEQ